MSVNGEIWNEIRRLEQTVDALAERVFHLENPTRDNSQKPAAKKAAAKKTEPEPNKPVEDLHF